MITCSVCGHLNSLDRLICEQCGSDLSDSPEWNSYDDDLNFDESEDLGYIDSEYYD